jgi:hypothetical protein
MVYNDTNYTKLSDYINELRLILNALISSLYSKAIEKQEDKSKVVSNNIELLHDALNELNGSVDGRLTTIASGSGTAINTVITGINEKNLITPPLASAMISPGEPLKDFPEELEEEPENIELTNIKGKYLTKINSLISQINGIS